MHDSTPAVPIVALPRYADWLTTEAAAQQVGTSSVVVNGWIVSGVKSDTGTIRLRAVKVGGRWRIEPAAVAEFIAATTRAALPQSATAPATAPTPAEETAADRNRRAAECMARLRQAGIATVAVPGPTRRTRTRRNDNAEAR
jgi:hypothetical protein